MNDLDILFPAGATLQTEGELIPVLPLRVRQFAPMMRAMQPVMAFFRIETKEVDIDALMQSPDVLRIIGIGIERDDSFVAGLKWNQQLNALLLVIGANPDFFFPDAVGATDEAGQDGALAKAFQNLIASGHRWPDIQEYSLAQIGLFDAAAGRLQRDANRMALLSARAAWSDAPLFKQLLDALDGKGLIDGQ
jgi:hypothetical protein